MSRYCGTGCHKMVIKNVAVCKGEYKHETLADFETTGLITILDKPTTTTQQLGLFMSERTVSQKLSTPPNPASALDARSASIKLRESNSGQSGTDRASAARFAETFATGLERWGGGVALFVYSAAYYHIMNTSGTSKVFRQNI